RVGAGGRARRSPGLPGVQGTLRGSRRREVHGRLPPDLLHPLERRAPGPGRLPVRGSCQRVRAGRPGGEPVGRRWSQEGHLIAMIPLKYNVRNLRVRWKTTMMTVLGTGLVVWSSCILFGLVEGMEHSLAISGDPLDVIVMRKGSSTETTGGF